MKRILLILSFFGLLMAAVPYTGQFTIDHAISFEPVTETLSNVILSGKVTDEYGRGIPRVTVYYFSLMMVFDSTYTDDAGNWELAVTGPDSIYIFPLMSDEDMGIFSPPMMDLYIVPGDTVTDLNFVYYPEILDESYISGNVSYEYGEPAEYVSVYAYNEDYGDYYAMTDSDGDYTIDLPAGSWEAYCYASGYSSSPEAVHVMVGSGSGAEGIDFVLLESTDVGISGRVTNSDGHPFGGVEIIAESVEGGIGTVTETDYDGYYTIYVYDGTWIITPDVRGYTVDPTSYRVTMEPGVPATGYDFVLTSIDFDATVSGTVIYDYGEPAGYIELVARSGSETFYTETDWYGNYTMGLTAGTYVLSISVGYWDSDPAEYDLTVVDGDALTGYDFRLLEAMPDPDAWITGRVIDTETDEGIPYVTIEAYGSFFYYEAVTDADGYYTLEVEGGDGIEIYCWLDGYMVSPEYYYESVGSGDTLSGINFEATPYGPPDAYITGRCEFRDGSPVPGQYIYAYSYSGFEAEAISDSDGYYTLSVMSGSMYEVYCDSWEYMSSPDYYEIYSIGAGDSLTGYDFVLTDFMTMFEIQVEVVDEAGFAVADVEVALFMGSSTIPYMTLRTDDEGYALFYPEEPGSYIVRVPDHTTEPEENVVYIDEEDPYAWCEFIIGEEVPVEYTICVLSRDSSAVVFPNLGVDWRYMGHSDWYEFDTGLDGEYTFTADSAFAIDFRPQSPEGFDVTPMMTSVSLTTVNPQDTVLFTVIPESGVKENMLPNEVSLSAYPNPFNGSVRIARPDGEPVLIYDRQGRLIDRVSGSDWTPGCGSGVYIAKTNRQSIKLFYVK